MRFAISIKSSNDENSNGDHATLIGHRTVVLVGGGHTHVQVLRRWAMNPPADVRLLVVLDRAVAVYSGMVPGFVAGDYASHELEIDVVPLARRAKAGVILSAAKSIDPLRKTISIEGRPEIRFDLASIDVGSTVRGLESPGIREHTLATRPIGHFVQKIDAQLKAFAALSHPPRILIVGGGAAGTELAFTIRARLRRTGLKPSIAVITSDSELLAGASKRTRRAIQKEAAEQRIESIFSRRVLRADSSGVVVEATDAGPQADAETHLAADLVVWATGAAPVAFPMDENGPALPRDKSGFIKIRDTLQTVGHDDLFAVGDCARLVRHPWVPRAGVYAVRQGPFLDYNLRARLEEKPLRNYHPQKDFLSLLHLGNKRALGSKWGMALAGKRTYQLKDSIDRRFMSRFQVLDEAGRPNPAMAQVGAMTSDQGRGESEPEMACGGCAAKLGAEPLSAALSQLPAAAPDDSVLLGLDARDDVAATRDANGRVTLHNIDVIRAFCDDPWLVGQVAASNALSDLFAKGGRPRYAQAVMGLPDLPSDAAQEMLFQALSGMRAILDQEGVSLLGGHTTIGDHLTVGLAVAGDAPEEGRLLRQADARTGDDILLAGQIGTGVVLAADQMGHAKGEWVAVAHAAMQHTNAIPGRLALEGGAHASTDVTGFGFAGHLLTLLDQTDLVAEIDRSTMPFLPGARLLWNSDLRSTAHPMNRAAFLPRIEAATESDEAWLFDPQTSGGLLFTLPPEQTPAMIEAFNHAGHSPITRIGRLVTDEASPRGKARHQIRLHGDDPTP